MSRIVIDINCNPTTCGDCHMLTFREQKYSNYWCMAYNTVPEGFPVKRCRYCIDNELEPRPLPTQSSEVKHEP